MFNEIVKIDGRSTYKVDEYISGNKDIVVYDIPDGIPNVLFNRIVSYLLEGKEIHKFDENRNIIDSVYSDYILIEYIDSDIMKQDIINNSKIEVINKLKSKEIDENKQIAENIGNFELNGKYYLIVNPYNQFTEELNPEKGIYKGVIIDSEKYFKVGNEVQKVVSRIDEIL
ncbi:MAG: hypothetical protein PHR68_01995 [Candidatus Gracilibacteria bacterium]|nr:hypothetical protein [Candidatus Gracilibacteria bacterium]